MSFASKTPSSPIKLSTLLMTKTVVLAVLLGMFFGLIQITLDLLAEKGGMEKRVNDIVLLVKDSAVQSAYNLDKKQAEKMIDGLLSHSGIKVASIEDEHGGLLASATMPFESSPYDFFVEVTFGRRHKYTYPLLVETQKQILNVGTLRIEVDSLPNVIDFISRSMTTVLSGLARNIILGAVLIVLYRRVLVDPLQRLLEQLSFMTPDNPASKSIDADDYKKKNNTVDMNELVEGINRLFFSAKDSIENIRHNDQLKQQILNVLSHELRTPMNAVLGNLDILKSEVAPDLTGLVDEARDSANVLISLLGRVLVFSELQSGCYHVNKTPQNLSAVLEYMENNYPKVLVIYDSKINSQEFMIDAELINKITQQLFDNLLKFSNVESAYCKISVDENDDFEMDVVDDGPGISEIEKRHIDKLLEQGEHGFNRKYDGLGIGLTVCHLAANTLGGSFCYEANELGGTTFKLKLPFNRAVKNADTLDASSGRSLDKRKDEVDIEANVIDKNISVLLVEDNEINQLIELRMLSTINCNTVVANNGVEALKILKTQTFDVILMDCQMPIMDGFEATKAIRESGESIKDIPIIAVTANVLSGDKEACLAAGMDDYIAKPVLVDILKEKLARWA